MFYRTIAKSLLFKLDPEKAHHSTINFAKNASHNPLLKNLARQFYYYESPLLSQEILGIHFPNPVGLAAGFDKNGEAAGIFEHVGFGFVEVGSITANPSSGNPLPRSFRLPRDHGLINRMGLNNDGADIITHRLSGNKLSIPLGINIAKTHDPSILGDAAVRDYVFSFKKAEPVADYITINISCPNTTEGKTFEDKTALKELLTAINEAKSDKTPPLFVKFSVDLTRKELAILMDICEKLNIDGYVATNTSTSREHLKTSQDRLKKIGKGGLSGRPIAGRSTRIIQWIYDIVGESKPIIGIGGIDSPQSAIQKIKAGASLIQVYTGLIYEGPVLVRNINKAVVSYMKERQIKTIKEIRQMQS